MEITLSELYSAIDILYITPDNMPEYKKNQSIVTSIYNDELATGYVLLKELIRLNTTLPIEVFYNDGELDNTQINILKNINPSQITIKKINGTAKKFQTQYGNTVGWSTKIYSLYESEYSENLWIDSDNFPIKNPEFLFQDQEYKNKGCLFWRDVFSTDRANRYHDKSPFWAVFNVPPNDAEPFEAGQLLINKPNVWKQFKLVKHYADNCDIYYNFGGDTETFRMAWQYHNRRYGYYHAYINYHSSNEVPYGFMPYGPFHKGAPNQFGKWGGGTVMVQRDRYGVELFNHRNINKFNLNHNVYNDDIINESFYHQHIENLKEILKV